MEARSFIGLVSYFRKFLPTVSALLQPIQATVTMKPRFFWTDEAEGAFQSCKALLTVNLCLSFPNFNLPFVLSTDASSFAAGAVLEQEHGVVSYFSRKFIGSERNYPTYEKELFAVYLSVKKFSHYLRPKQFTIVTDNSAVSAFLKTETTNPRVIRWITYLLSFSFVIIHKSGKENPVADFCSRYPVSTLQETTKLESIATYLKDPTNAAVSSNILRLAQNYLLLNGQLYRKAKPFPKKVLSATELQQTLKY